MENKNSPNLLKYIELNDDCRYLSDLFYVCHPSLVSITHIMSVIDPAQYGLREWNDPVQYITGMKEEFGSAEEVVHYLSGASAKNQEGRWENDWLP